MLKTLLSFQGYRRPQGPAGPRFRTAGPVARLGRWLLAAGLGLLGAQATQAQNLNYTPTNAVNAAGTFTDIATTGTAIATANTDAANSAPQAIGFTFSFNNTAFTQFVLNTNGFIKLGATPPSAANLHYQAETTLGGDALGSANAADVNILAPFNVDLESGTAAGGATYQVRTTGVAGSQVCTIQWTNVRDKMLTNTPQYDSFTFQARLFEGTNNIEFVYGPTVAGVTGASAFRLGAIGIKGSGATTGQTVLVNKTSSSSAWSTAVFIAGPYGTSAFNYRRTFPADLGRTFRFVPNPAVANDVAVTSVFSLGQVAQSYNSPHVAQAIVTNNSSGTLTNIPVTLTVTGANSFTNTQTVASLAAGATTLVTFASYPLAALGVNTLTVTVPPDDVNTNNSKTYSQNVTASRLAYIDATQPLNATGVGVGSANGVLAARYTLAQAGTISSVTPTFVGAGAGATTYQVLLYDATGAGGTPGAILYTSSVQTRPTATGSPVVTIPNVPIPAGDFFVGIKELDLNLGLGYQVEDPLRANTFYFQSGGAFTPVNSTTLRTRLAIEVNVVPAPACSPLGDLAATSVTSNSASLTFTSAAGSSYTVTYTPAGGAATTVTPNPTASPVNLTGLTPGTAYSVSVVTNCPGGTMSPAATVTFTTPFPVPANDLCSGAIALACGQTVTGTTNGATTTGSPSGTCTTTTVRAAPGVFYSFLGTGDIVTASTCSGPTATTGDTQLFVYSGSCGTFTCVGGNDDAAGCGTNGAASVVTFPSVAGTQYYLFVQAYTGTVNFGLSLTCVAPPSCPPVTALTAGSITATSASLSFTAGAGNTSYAVTYTPSGGSPTTVTPAPTASPVALTGLTPNTTYAVSVTGNCSASSTTSSAATTSFTTLFPTPANDLCSGAIALACGQTVTGTTNGATTTGSPSGTCTTTTVRAAPGVFYSFLGTGDIVTASTCSGPTATTGDTQLFVYSGSCGTFTCVGGNDDAAGCGTNGAASVVTFPSVAGTQYYLFVQAYTGTVDFGLSLTCVAPAPQSLTVTNGQNVTASGPYSTITVQSGGTLTLAGPTSATGAVQIQTGGVFITACQALTGAGSFELQTGAELRICDPAGIATSGATGAVQLSGTRTYASDASYTYNGTVAQLTGSGLPGTVRNLTVNNATGLSLSQGVSITQVARLTNGNLTTGGQAFTLLSSAAGTALLDNTGGTVAGTGTMQRAITSANPLGYRHYSTPVAQTAVSALGAPVTNPFYNSSPTPGTASPFPTIFGYDESRVGTVTSNYSPFDQGWFSPASSSTLMLLNRGYTVNTGSSTTVSFTGTFNNAAQNSGSLSRGTDAQAGWQLLGNPYPSPLDWSTVTTGQMPGMDGSMYVFQSSGQYGGSYRSYQNGVGGPSPLIDAGSGYFARVTAPGTPGAVNLTNANRVTNFGAQPAFGRGLQDTRPQLHLQLAGAGRHDDAFLYLETGATTGLDAYFDATKLANPSGLDLASLAGNEALVINGLAPLTTTDVVVPLVLRVPQAGSFTLEVANLDNFGTTTVYLRDALTGTQQVLTAGTRYAFTLATATAGNGRFSVVFRPATVTATTNSLNSGTVSVYPNPAQSSFTLLLPPLAGQHAVHATLLNALGQVVLMRTIGLTAAGATASFDTQLLATGVYTLRLQAENQVMSSRVVIK